MTTTLTAAELGQSLATSLMQLGLEVRVVPVTEASPALGGPLLLIRMPVQAGCGTDVSVVSVDRGQEDSEQVVQSLAQAAAGILSDLLVGDASMEAVAALDPVVASFDAPAEAALVLRGGSAIGAVLWAVDRRQQPGAAAYGHTGYAEASLFSNSHPAPVLPPILGSGQASMQLLRDVHLDVSVELGRTEMTVAEVLELTVGAVVELDRAARAPVDIRVNGTLLAKGEVVVVDDEYAVRVTEIVDPASGIGG